MKFLNGLLPRMWHWAIVALLLLAAIAFTAPQQLGVLLYKVAMVALFGVLGYWLDRGLFPYARPDSFKQPAAGMPEEMRKNYSGIEYYLCSFSMIRRAIIIAACMLAGANGL